MSRVGSYINGWITNKLTKKILSSNNFLQLQLSLKTNLKYIFIKWYSLRFTKNDLLWLNMEFKKIKYTFESCDCILKLYQMYKIAL